jgi:hypothetical protein
MAEPLTPDGLSFLLQRCDDAHDASLLRDHIAAILALREREPGR